MPYVDITFSADTDDAQITERRHRLVVDLMSQVGEIVADSLNEAFATSMSEDHVVAKLHVGSPEDRNVADIEVVVTLSPITGFRNIDSDLTEVWSDFRSRLIAKIYAFLEAKLNDLKRAKIATLDVEVRLVPMLGASVDVLSGLVVHTWGGEQLCDTWVSDLLPL